jgi:hypothetical protein
MNIPLAVVAIIVLRIGLPFALTILFCYIAHRMNQRWQDQAARAPKEVLADETLPKKRRSAHI